MQTYLDHNASSPLRPEARAAMAAAMEVTGNPSSIHGAGRAARALVEQAREQVAALVGARPQDVIFTGSGTEANNQAVASLRTRGLRVSSIEHEATLAADPAQPRWPTQRNGQVFPPASWPSEIGAVALMAANNETGVLQPLKRACCQARIRGCYFYSRRRARAATASGQRKSHRNCRLWRCCRCESGRASTGPLGRGAALA